MIKILRIFVITNIFIAISLACYAQTIIGVRTTTRTSITNYNCPEGEVFFYDPVHRTGYCGISSYYPYANIYVSRTAVTPKLVYSTKLRNRRVCKTYLYSNNREYTYCKNNIETNPSYVYKMPTYVYYGNIDPYPYLREERAIRNSPRCPAGYLYIPASNLCASPN